MTSNDIYRLYHSNNLNIMYFIPAVENIGKLDKSRTSYIE